MHIVHIIFSFHLGGAELMLIDIMNEQIKTNTVSLIIVNNYNTTLFDKIDRNIDIILINRKPGSKNIFPIVRINYLLFRTKVDVLHCHDEGLLSLIIFKRNKAILTLHTTNITSKNFSRYKYLFSISNAVKEDLFNRYRIKSYVIYNGVKPSNILKREENSFCSSSIIRLLQVSRLEHSTKGQDLLIKAIAELVKKNINVSVDFIGEGSSFTYLKKITSELQLNSYINFLGIRDREYVYSHIANYDLLIQPSRNEGFGLTIVEAMFAKVPVLISNIEGPMEIINNGEFGFYFEKGNAMDLVKKLVSLMEGQEPIKDLEEVYNYAQSNFSIQNTVSQYEKYYKML